MASPAFRRTREELQARRDLIIAALAAVSVGIGAFELLRPRTRPGFTALDAVDLGIVLVFIVDFVVHARASGNWKAYVRRHWWELPSLIPITGAFLEGAAAYSVVRGVRLVRLVRALRLLRLIGVAARARRALRFAGRVVERARVGLLAGVGALIVLAGAAAFHAAESGTNPRVLTGWDSLWWSLNVFTTVSHVDFFPATTGGRIVAAFLMVLGVGFIGVFTASLATAILSEPRPDEVPDEPEERPGPLD